MTAASWWNINYPIRRNLKITPLTGLSLDPGHPVYAIYDPDNLIGLEKMLESYEDLEILYYNQAEEEWTLVARNVYLNTDNYLVATFNVLNEITTTNYDYYIHMGNPTLTGVEPRPEYESALYVITATPLNGLGLMFSRPTEDWNGGESLNTNARATLSFIGITMRLIVEKGPDRGILEVKLDNSTPTFIDCYSTQVEQVSVYELSDLDPQRHYVRMRVTGDKAPSSTGSSIKIVSMQYSRYVPCVDQGEEFYSLTGPITSIVGP